MKCESGSAGDRGALASGTSGACPDRPGFGRRLSGRALARANGVLLPAEQQRGADGSAGPSSGRVLPDANGGIPGGDRLGAGYRVGCRDSIPLREFLGYALAKMPPEHSTLSKTRKRLSLEAHGAVFGWALERLDMETGVAAVTVQTMDGGDTASLPVTLHETEQRLAR